MIKEQQEKIYRFSKRWGDKLGLDLPYFVKNGFWVVLQQGVGTLSGVALYVVFARLSTQEVFGQYQFILSIFSVVSILSIPGLNTSIIRSVARGYDGDYKKVVKVSFFWSLLGVPALLIVGAYYYWFQSHPLGIALMLSSVFFPFFYAPNTWDSFLRGKGRFDVSTKYGIIQSAMNALVTIVVVFFFRNNLIAIVVTYLVSFTFFNGYYYWRSLSYMENEKKDGEVFKYGWFLTKINVLGVIAGNIDSLLVGVILGPIDLAIYTVVSLVSNRLSSVLGSFLSIIFPKIAQSKQSFSMLVKVHKRKMIFLMLFSFLVAVLFYILIPDVNRILFGNKYIQSFPLSRIFFISIFLSFPTAFLGYYISASKDTFSIWLSGPVFYVIRILLNFYLISYYRLPGAVWAANLLTIIISIIYIYGILHTEKSTQTI